VHLPGIGERIELVDETGADVAVIRRHDGRVEIERRTRGGSGTGPDDRARIELDEPAARTLGAFVTGHYLLPEDLAEQLDEVRGGLVFDWHRLGPKAPAVGRSISDLAIRQKTGVTIVAVIRREGAIIDPDPVVVLGAGDVLVTASRASARDAFVQLLEGGPDGA
jgi:TrkA domain protein